MVHSKDAHGVQMYVVSASGGPHEVRLKPDTDVPGYQFLLDFLKIDFGILPVTI